MSFLFAQSETNVKAPGTACSVPNGDVNKLSYYLRCGTVSCGLDIIVDELLDYKNVHKLPSHRQDAIFLLAYDDFDLETLGNKTIFLDDENTILPRNTNNEFYELEKVQTFLTAQESILIGGQQKEVQKIMICNKKWLMQFYAEPLQRNESRIRRILAAKNEQEKKSMTPGDMLAVALMQLILNNNDEESKSQHCEHCRGLDGVCACEDGCYAKVESKCQVVHKTVTCDLCMTTGIKGTRYTCRECYNFDLCERCFESGQHAAGTHAVDRVARVGSKPVYIQPKKSLSIPTPVTPSKQRDPPTQVTPDTHKDSEPEIAIPIAEAVVAPSFRVGQTVRLTGLVQKPERNGRSVVVMHDMGSRVVVSFPDNGEKITVQAANLEVVREIGIPAGSVVEIHGITMDASLNGELGIVVDISTEAKSSSDRVRVRLLTDEKRILSLKPENIRIVEDEA